MGKFKKIIAEIKVSIKDQKEDFEEDLDHNTINDWAQCLCGHIYEATKDCGNSGNELFLQQRDNLILAAASAIVALEALDENGSFAPRHYDGYAFGEDLSLEGDEDENADDDVDEDDFEDDEDFDDEDDFDDDEDDEDDDEDDFDDDEDLDGDVDKDEEDPL